MCKSPPLPFAEMGCQRRGGRKEGVVAELLLPAAPASACPADAALCLLCCRRLCVAPALSHSFNSHPAKARIFNVHSIIVFTHHNARIREGSLSLVRPLICRERLGSGAARAGRASVAMASRAAAVIAVALALCVTLAAGFKEHEFKVRLGGVHRKGQGKDRDWEKLRSGAAPDARARMCISLSPPVCNGSS